MTRLFFTLALLLVAGNLLRAQTILVSSRNTNSVKQYDPDGNYLGDFVAANSGGLSLPQEVVWHPDGFLLVTGRGNSSVKKYDGVTGAYLGNFTSGYVLDNPTKTTIWQDSLLYVSQWGASKNKIVRFNLKTGAFVDEFTQVGVPNGCGHAWDAGGNLLVAQFGNGANGKVLRFDPEGAYLGDFIPSTQLQGPVNLWFDTAGSLLVADWTLGSVLKFNGSKGDFESVPVSGLTNVEGFAFDAGGRLYLCDWTQNKVFRYDFAAGTLTPFIVSGGLVAPNSILIRQGTIATDNAARNRTRLQVSPNPASGPLRVSYFLEKTTAVQLEVVDTLGRTVAVVFSGRQTAGDHAETWTGLKTNGLQTEAGMYFIRLTAGDTVETIPMFWK